MNLTSGYIFRMKSVFKLSKKIFVGEKRKSGDRRLQKHLLGDVIAFHRKGSFRSS
jgi:hypothetical protein